MFIYKITNTLNNKVYIGRSKDPVERFTQHIGAAESGSDLVFSRAIRKYGKETFELSVLEETEASDEREKFYIKEYDCCILDGAEKGYNMTRGGDGFDSEATKHFMKIITEEGRNPFSKGNSGNVIAEKSNRSRVESGTHNFQSQEHRNKVSETQKKLVLSDNHSLSGKRGSEQSKAVQAKRIANGTFHMQQPEMKAHQRDMVNKALEEGRHNSQVQHICPHCDKVGMGPMMFRWHFDNCKHK